MQGCFCAGRFVCVIVLIVLVPLRILRLLLLLLLLRILPLRILHVYFYVNVHTGEKTRTHNELVVFFFGEKAT